AYLLDEAVLDQRPERRDPVPPVDLLPRVHLATRVRDRHLVDPDAAPQHLGRDLRLEVETVSPQPDPVEKLPVEELETGLHIGERRVEENVCDQRQEAIAQPM